MSLCSVFTVYWSLTSCKKLERKNLNILSYGIPHLFWSQKWVIWAQYQKIRNFSLLSLCSVFTFYWFLTSCKELERKSLNFLSYCGMHLFRSQKWAIWAQYQKVRNFSNFSIWSVFIFYWSLTSCKKLERKNLNILSFGIPHLFRSQKWTIWAQYKKNRNFS